jgi:type IV secretory pathway VirB10-like protein
MAIPERDTVYSNDGTNRTVYTRESSSTGWFVGIIVALALLAIGYLVFSANSGPATTDVDVTTPPATTTPMVETPAPAEPAPMTEAPAAETPAPADAAPAAEPAPVTEPAPAAEPAPATEPAPAAPPA